MAEYQINEDNCRNENSTHIYPLPTEIEDDDKYFPTFGIEKETEQKTTVENFQTTSLEELTNEGNSVDVTEMKNSHTTNTTNQERRRANRLQSGAMNDKYHNAQRFPGGHNQVNAERQKPSPVDNPGNDSPHQSSQHSRSGAMNDKYLNAQRFPGGHNPVNAERQKPSPVDNPGTDSAHQSSQHSRSLHENGSNRNLDGSDFSRDYLKSSFVHKETDEFVFFFTYKSPFSQWHPAKFVIDGIEFNCAEQYMMYNKATEKDPGEQKNYGRSIPNFDADLWMTKREEVVKRANKAKFSQNEFLREQLFNTYPKTLVEASPSDNVWGIGLSANDPDAVKKECWRGENLLGKIITEVRDELLKETGFLQ